MMLLVDWAGLTETIGDTLKVGEGSQDCQWLIGGVGQSVAMGCHWAVQEIVVSAAPQESEPASLQYTNQTTFDTQPILGPTQVLITRSDHSLLAAKLVCVDCWVGCHVCDSQSQRVVNEKREGGTVTKSWAVKSCVDGWWIGASDQIEARCNRESSKNSTGLRPRADGAGYFSARLLLQFRQDASSDPATFTTRQLGQDECTNKVW